MNDYTKESLEKTLNKTGQSVIYSTENGNYFAVVNEPEGKQELIRNLTGMYQEELQEKLRIVLNASPRKLKILELETKKEEIEKEIQDLLIIKDK